MKKQLFPVFFLTFTLVLLLGGCFLEYGDGLLSLPKLPGEYLQLQNKLDEILATGAVYASADTGSYRQSVQMIDLDGDGVDEVVAFFQAKSGAHRIYVYRRNGDEFEEIGMTEAAGMTLHAVHYPQYDGSGQRALAISWGMEDNGSYGMTVFRLSDKGLVNLLDIRYASLLIDSFDGDSIDELYFVVRDTVTLTQTLHMYCYLDGTYQVNAIAQLCGEARSVANMQMGYIAPGQPAIFIDSVALGGGYVTDVLRISQGTIYNETLATATRSGLGTWRPISVFSTDIDKDGVIEVPVATTIEADGQYNDLKYKLKWCIFRSGANIREVCQTFHNAAEEWYILWPETWGDMIGVRKQTMSGVNITTFYVKPDYLLAGNSPFDDLNVLKMDLVSIYAFAGDSRVGYFTSQGVKILTETNTMTYGYLLHQSDFPELQLNDQELKTLLMRIEKKWMTE